MPVEVRSITFEWKLDGFRKLKPQKYTSDYFWTSERHPWCLAFYPFGYSESTSSKYVSLFLHAVYNDTFKQIYFARKEVTFEVSVHVGDVAVGPYRIYHDFVAQERNIGWPEFRLRSKLINAAKTDEAPILLKVLIQIPNVAMYPSLHKVCVAYIGDHFREVRETGAMANVEWTDDDWKDYVELAKEIK
ncbi:hypothetical protein BC938DRAFT_475365 [Jimgerdemannia flammicorona]|uniref:MATH domain-containing protein n=1 Tax=Jimgerdemannia flammicorona TaxID=994334 RepID=A0A433QRQ8_9FUNG|nr:hypothetical protein BC938DRAFT_475365 [Jimgerdemannia flammicorona]